jgi:hypothetical protein
MSVEKEIRKILGEATPASVRAKKELVRSGLGHDKNAAAVMKALQDPEAAMKNPAKREMLLKVMQDLLDVVVNDPTMVTKTKMALRKEEVEEFEELDEKLHPNQKKLDKNKNGKLDAEDFKKLRGEAKKPKAEDDEEDEDEMDDEDEKVDKYLKKKYQKEEAEIQESDAAWAASQEKRKEKKLTHNDQDKLGQVRALMAREKEAKAKMKKEDVELDEAAKGAKPGWMLKQDPELAKKVKDSKRGQEALKKWAGKSVPKDTKSVDESAWGKDKAGNMKAALDRHSEKAIAANKAGDDAAVKVHQAKMNAIKNKMAKMAKNESVTTDYKLVKGQTQNKTPSEKLATDYKLATKKVAKVNEAKDPREYDYEGDMAKSQLRSIMANAKQAHDMLKDDTNMAEWVQSKITLAADYISTVADYMQSEVNEGHEINESGGPVVFKKGEHHVEKYSDDSFALYKSGKKQEFYPTLAAAKTAMKEETQVDEAFPTVADAKKRMKDALKSKFEKKKISTGTVYTKKYKDEKDDEKKEK